MCCGSRRAAYHAGYAPAARAPSASPGPAPQARPAQTASPAGPPAHGAFPTVMLDYAEYAPIRVRGPVTGRPYAFQAFGAAQPVDARDAAVLTSNRSFRPA
jgi:hypothetical protein